MLHAIILAARALFISSIASSIGIALIDTFEGLMRFLRVKVFKFQVKDDEVNDNAELAAAA